MQVSIPLQNEDGSLKYEVVMNEKEVQAVLQFGLNMAMAMGITAELVNPDMAALLEDDQEDYDD